MLFRSLSTVTRATPARRKPRTFTAPVVTSMTGGCRRLSIAGAGEGGVERPHKTLAAFDEGAEGGKGQVVGFSDNFRRPVLIRDPTQQFVELGKPGVSEPLLMHIGEEAFLEVRTVGRRGGAIRAVSRTGEVDRQAPLVVAREKKFSLREERFA